VTTTTARSWAGELYEAVSVAHREATGDPHALTDLELSSLQEHPARIRFHLALDIEASAYPP
jgi:hypothetical protein